MSTPPITPPPKPMSLAKLATIFAVIFGIAFGLCSIASITAGNNVNQVSAFIGVAAVIEAVCAIGLIVVAIKAIARSSRKTR